MILFDTNVLLDIATADPIWLSWSENEFRTAAAQGPILINPIIYAEVSIGFKRIEELEAKLGGPPKTPDNSSIPPSQARKPSRAERRADRSRYVGHALAGKALPHHPPTAA